MVVKVKIIGAIAMVTKQQLLSGINLLQIFSFFVVSSLWFVGLICDMAVVFAINSSHIVNRKEIVIGFASHHFTLSCLQCLHY